MMTTGDMFAVQQTGGAVSGTMAKIQIKLLKNMIGEDSLPNKLLEMMQKTSANTQQALQATAQSQISNGYLDIKV